MQKDPTDVQEEEQQQIVFCRCGERAIVKVCQRSERDPANIGREFYTCPRMRDQGGCGFFQWVDQPRAPTPHPSKLPIRPVFPGGRGSLGPRRTYAKPQAQLMDEAIPMAVQDFDDNKENLPPGTYLLKSVNSGGGGILSAGQVMDTTPMNKTTGSAQVPAAPRKRVYAVRRLPPTSDDETRCFTAVNESTPLRRLQRTASNSTGMGDIAGEFMQAAREMKNGMKETNEALDLLKVAAGTLAQFVFALRDDAASDGGPPAKRRRLMLDSCDVKTPATVKDSEVDITDDDEEPVLLPVDKKGGGSSSSSSSNAVKKPTP